jgi:hypothetical protein
MLTGLLAVMVLIAAVVVAMKLGEEPNGEDGVTRNGAQIAGTENPADGQISITPVRIRHLEKNSSRLRGDIGTTSYAANFADSVQVDVQLSEPGFCYLVACNPDGKTQLCYPASQDAAPESLQSIRFPPDRDSAFALTDGIGFQAFMVIGSRHPLPPYREWSTRIGQVPWEPTQGAGVWTYDGADFRRQDKERGEIISLDVPKPMKELCDFLKHCGDAESVFVIVFPVEMPERRGAETLEVDDGT